jgi:hypothetical protein
MEFQSLGKWLIGAGTIILLVGIAFQFLPRLPYIGRLPGDIVIKREHFTFYFPLATCILISILFTLISRFFGHK